jgi:hypothetical protein
LTNTFNLQKVQDNLQAGQIAGQVGMTAAGDVEQAAGLQNGSAGATVIHTVVGGAAAALGGGNVAQGALGAGAGEAATPYLENHLGNTGTAIGATVIGALVGGGAGASTALAGDLYNRQLHPNEIQILDQNAEAFAKQLYGDNPTSGQIADADARLLAQANRDVNGNNDGLMDVQAEQIVNRLTGQYGNQGLPGGQSYFYAIGDSYFNNALYADTLNTPGGQAAYQQIANSHAGIPFAYPTQDQYHQTLTQQNALVSATNASAALQAGLVVCGASEGLLCAGLLGGASANSLYQGVQQVSDGHSTGWVGIGGGLAGLVGLGVSNGVLSSETAANIVARSTYLFGSKGSGVATTVNADGTLTLTGPASSLNAVSDFEQLATGPQATPTPGGYINQAKVCTTQCVFTLNPADQSLATQIAQNGDPTGALTESLVDSVAKNQGMTVLSGGKYGSNNGFDAVLQNPNGSVTIVVDAKQMTNGTFALNQLADNTVQLSPKWIDYVMGQIDETSPAYLAIKQASLDGTLSTAVVGVNKTTGQLIGVPVNMPSTH